MGGKSGSYNIYDFLLSVDFGICHGPIYSLNEIIIKDKSAFVGPVFDSGEFTINKPDLFGGDTAEGGPVGVVEFYRGDWDQACSPHLSARHDLDPADIPGLRGLTHCFFRGETSNSAGGALDPAYDPEVVGFSLWKYVWANVLGAFKYTGAKFGFKWTTNNPYFPGQAFRVTRAANGILGGFTYPIVEIDGSYGEPTNPVVNALEDPYTYVKLRKFLSNVDDPFFWEPYPTTPAPQGDGTKGRFQSVSWPIENHDNMILTMALMTDVYPKLNRETGEVITDIDTSLLGQGSEMTFSDAYALTGNYSISGNEQLTIARYTAQGVLYLQTEGAQGSLNGTNVQFLVTVNNTPSTPGYVNNRSYTWTHDQQYVLYRITWHINGAWYLFGTTNYKAIHGLDFSVPNPQPYLPPDWGIAGPGDAFIDGQLDPTKLPDANPADIIYECMTNEDWGKGEPLAAMDDASYTAAYNTLVAENFGLSMIFVRQDTIENFVQEVLDHIRAAQYIDRKTGLWTLKLIRGDYNVATLPLFDESNAELDEMRTRTWGETINEIIVEWTDPVSEERDQVSAKNLANMQIQGGIVSETRDYYGIRNPFLAQMVAERDVTEASQALTSVTLACNREAEDIQIGDVIKFSWAEEGIVEMVLRVNSVKYGTDQNRAVILNCIQDVYSTPTSGVFNPREPAVPTDQGIPLPMDEIITITPPLPPAIRRGLDVDQLAADYPRGAALFFAYSATFVPNGIEAWADTVQPNGAVAPAKRTTFSMTRKSSVPAMVQEARSDLAGVIIEEALYAQGAVGDIFMLGDTEALHEFVMLDSYDAGTDVWTVIRGLYDTLPRAWVEGTQIHHAPSSATQTDFADMAPGTEITYTYLTVASGGTQEYANGATGTFTPTERLHAPFRPANVAMNGDTGFAQFLVEPPNAGTFVVSWANRNRLDEDLVALAWDDANVTPEVGQTTSIEVTRVSDSAVLYSVTGLTGTSHNVNSAGMIGQDVLKLSVWSVRDGVPSIMKHERLFTIDLSGYGYNYGGDYGDDAGLTPNDFTDEFTFEFE